MIDWIEWKGGECPVPFVTLVEVKTRGGGGRVVAGNVRWGHADRPEDIMAYRVVRPAEQPRTLTGVWVWRDARGVWHDRPDGDTVVEVRAISGDVTVDVAGAFNWSVVEAYRVVQPAEKPVSRGGVGAVETLRRAADLIEQRGKQRDSDTGERSMARTVAAFNAIYGTDLTETQGWHFMELLKMARSSQGAYVADDFDDKVAYAALAAECEAGARGRTD